MDWDPEGVLGSIRSRPLILYMSKLHPGGRAVKSWPSSAEAAREKGSIPESERSPGGSNGNLLQYSCLENSVDRSLASKSMGSQRVRHTWATDQTEVEGKWSRDGNGDHQAAEDGMVLIPSLHALLLIQWDTGVQLAKSDLCKPLWVPWPQAGWRGQLTFSQPERDLPQSLEMAFSMCAQSDFPENCRVWAS